MKKTILAVIALTAVLATAWAGGAKEPAKGEAAKVPANVEWVTPDRIGNPEARTTVTFSMELSYSQQTGVASRKAYLTKVMTDWAKAHPDVKVELKLLPTSSTERIAKMMEQAASGTNPDACQIDHMFVTNFYKWLQPLDGLMSKEELDDWYSWCYDVMKDKNDGNKLKAVWMLTNASALWYNNKEIPNPPRSWDDMIKIGKQMTAKGYKYGTLLRGSKDEQINFGTVLPMFFGMGGKVIDENGKPVYGAGDNRQKLIDVYTFWKRAVDEGVLSQRVIDIKTDGDLIGEASKEKATAMFIGGSWTLSTMKDTFKEKIADWSFTTVPEKSADIKMAIPGGHTVCFFQKDQAKLAAIYDFMKTVYFSKEGMAGWCEAGGYTPVRKSVAATTFFTTDRLNKQFSEAISIGTVRPREPAYLVASEHLMEAFQNVILGQFAPDKAVDNAFQKTLNQLK